mgnify:CR=1 FL=1
MPIGFNHVTLYEILMDKEIGKLDDFIKEDCEVDKCPVAGP